MTKKFNVPKKERPLYYAFAHPKRNIVFTPEFPTVWERLQLIVCHCNLRSLEGMPSHSPKPNHTISNHKKTFRTWYSLSELELNSSQFPYPHWGQIMIYFLVIPLTITFEYQWLHTPYFAWGKSLERRLKLDFHLILKWPWRSSCTYFTISICSHVCSIMNTIHHTLLKYENYRFLEKK